MGRFAPSKATSDTPSVIKRALNYLIDLLDQGYYTTAIINNKKVEVTVSPQKPFELKIDGIKEIYVSDAGVLVPSRYDVNEDGRVDSTDIQLTSTYITTGVGYLPRMDVNGDGVVDVLDLTLITRNAINRVIVDRGSEVLNSTTWTTISTITFYDIPTISITVNDSSASDIHVKIKNVTTTSFDAILTGGVFAGITCDWMAIYD